MLTKKIQKMLNEQVEREAYVAFLYYSVGSWMEAEGFHGTSRFFYAQGDEEMDHMKKVFHYLNDADGKAVAPSIPQPPADFDSYYKVFEVGLENEQTVTKAINAIVEACLKEKDYTTFNLMQWYVDEQLEEETMFRNILDKLELVGNDKRGLYLLDRELGERVDRAAQGG